MTKARYYVVDIQTRKTLAWFHSFSTAQAYRLLLGDLEKIQIWGYDPRELQPRAYFDIDE